MDKSAVPKFGSFKPKGASKPATQEDQTQDQSRKSNERDGHSRRRRDDDSRRRHHRDRDSGEREPRHELSHRRRSHGSRAKTPEIETPIATDEFEESDLFIVDRRGDSKNVEYGSLHRYSIPAYRRTGYGKVLGNSSFMKIDRDGSNEKEVQLVSSERNHGRRTPRLLTSKHGRSTESKLRFVVPASDATESIEGDYIELQPSRKRKRGSDSSGAELTTVDYRSIEGKAKASDQPVDDGLEAASGSDSDDVDTDLQARHESAVLSKKAKAKPTDFDAWLALAEHQAKLVRPGVEPASFTSTERRILADLRLAILSEAAIHISKDRPDRDRLLRAIISEGSLIWDSAKRASKWKAALAECPNSVLLWTEYLNYIQDDHLGFRYDTCKEAYVQCLSMLREVIDKDGGNSISIERIQIYVFLRLTVFVRDAGFEELSIALWQALMEYQLRMPPGLKDSPPAERLGAFEEFWESEVPRIGETESNGWASYHQSGDISLRNPPQLEHTSPDTNRPYESFAELESTLQGFILPASTSDDDATSDPFRCVMFSDVSEVVELLSTDLPKKTLVDALLCFLGLPCVPSLDEDNPSLPWIRDPHLASAKTTLGGRSLDPDTVKLRCQRETTYSLFDDAFESFSLCAQNDDGLSGFVDRILEAVVAADPEDDGLAEYWLAFRLQRSPMETRNLAKRLLKQKSSRLRLYNAYALVEAKRGNLDKAQTVWRAALDANLGHDDGLLWHSRMIAQCRAKDEVTALRDISTIADPYTQFSRPHEDGLQVRRLRSKRMLEARLSDVILGGKFLVGKSSDNAHLTVDCLAWTEYLANSHDINAALHVYGKYSPRFEKNGQLVILELIQQCEARLLKMHIDRQRPFKPAVLRHELDEALVLFPRNSALLDLQARVAAQDRLRSLVHQGKGSNPGDMSIVEWSFRIAEELHRSGDDASGCTPNTVRAAFSKALTSADGVVKHSPALWMMWLRFEHGQTARLEGFRKREALAKTRQVFLDGLRSIPWVKRCVIMGMKLLSDTMSEGEMRQAYEVLVERGLRLRVDIEDLV